MSQELPIIDFGTTDEAAIGRQLDEAFSGTGFCYFRDIGVDQALVDRVFAASRRFHEQDMPAKQTLAMPASWARSATTRPTTVAAAALPP